MIKRKKHSSRSTRVFFIFKIFSSLFRLIRFNSVALQGFRQLSLRWIRLDRATLSSKHHYQKRTHQGTHAQSYAIQKDPLFVTGYQRFGHSDYSDYRSDQSHGSQYRQNNAGDRVRIIVFNLISARRFLDKAGLLPATDANIGVGA